MKSISIITPVFNCSQFLERTIRSVLDQGYANLEYIIIDGGSTDGTQDIIKRYQDRLTYWISEPDDGMYHALNKGFAISAGEIMGWINADDVLLPGSLERLNKIFSENMHVSWIQGQHSFIDLEGDLIGSNPSRQFTKLRFLTGDYKWIQQESTYWRRDLWERAGASLNQNLKLAGDFELWFRFFDYENLYSIDQKLGAWCRREGQLSEQLDRYIDEVNSVLGNYKMSRSERLKISEIRMLQRISRVTKKIKLPVYNIVDKRINSILNYQARSFKIHQN